MTEKQKRAADNFIETGDGIRALIKAGYSESYAKRFHKKFFEGSDTKKYITDKIKPVVVKNDTPSDEIIGYLTKVMRGEDEEMNSTQRMKAAELLWKYYSTNKECTKDIDIRPIVIYEDIKY